MLPLHLCSDIINVMYQYKIFLYKIQPGNYNLMDNLTKFNIRELFLFVYCNSVSTADIQRMRVMRITKKSASNTAINSFKMSLRKEDRYNEQLTV